MTDDARTRYLATFTFRAETAGLDMAKPGRNWAPIRPLAPGSHISLSINANQIQVNLNNDKDEDRTSFKSLFGELHAINAAIGEKLEWECKEGRKKTTVRATLGQGYADTNWDEQHTWAIKLMKAFTKEFGARLA